MKILKKKCLSYCSFYEIMSREDLNEKKAVSIIISVHNRYDLIVKNIPKFLEVLKYKPNNVIEVIVVDDNSSDRSAEIIKKEFSEIRLIRHSVTRGLSSLLNTGARASRGKFLAIFDIGKVPKKNFLENVFDYFADPEVFSVSLNCDENSSWNKGSFKDGYISVSSGEDTGKIHDTFLISMESSVFRRDYWMKVGGMDEKLLSPMFWESYDLSYRAMKRGLRNLWNDKVRVTYENGMSEKQSESLEKINELLFHWKNITSVNFFRRHIVGMLRRVIKNPLYVRIIILSLFRLSLTVKARKKELREAKISDEAIFAKFKKI